MFYETQDGKISIEVKFSNENIWLTQKHMAELFEVDVRTVSEHIQNIFASKELNKDSVLRNFRNTAADGKNYMTQFYNLEAVIAVGYRVNSERGISQLNRIVNIYMDYAEFQAARGKIMSMLDWTEKLDAFFKFNEQEILTNHGKVPHEVAVALAEKEYEVFRKK